MRTNMMSAVAAALMAFALAGCSQDVTTPKASQQTINSDIAKIYHPQDYPGTLTFEDALALGLKYNLDARVAAYGELAQEGDVTLAKLAALPDINGKLDYIGRNNRGASSSLSVLTNTQSLEPSVSTDQYRTTEQLAMDWNLLDAALSVVKAKSASDQVRIMEERRRKVFHSVVQDIYSAYWRAAAAQQMNTMIDGLLAETDSQAARIDQGIHDGIVVVSDARRTKSDLMAKKQQLIELQSQVAFSELALKALIGLPPSAGIHLADADVRWITRQRLPKTNNNLASLEGIALANRPEVREELLNKNIALRDMRMAIYETFPGADIILALNHDRNHFLVDKTWVSITGEIAQNITKILTLPARYDKAKGTSELADARRQALVAAVITEVHVAHARFDFFNKDYQTVASIAADKAEDLRRAKNMKGAGIAGNSEVVGAKLDEAIAHVNERLAYAQAAEAYGQLLSSLGVDLVDHKTPGVSTPDLSGSVKRSLAALEHGILDEPAAGEGGAPAQ